MFNLHDFVINTITRMIGNEPDYKVMEYSLKWYDKQVLKDEDLILIENKINEKNELDEDTTYYI